MNRLKDQVKNIAPQWVISFFQRMNNKKECFIGFAYDKRRFLRSYSKVNLSKNNQAQIAGRLVFHAHALEKGLSHNHVRLGFGKSALKALGDNISVYELKGYSKKDKSYINSLSVLSAYIELHEKSDFDISYLSNYFSDEFIATAKKDKSDIGGAITVAATNKRDNLSANFETLFNNRWSVREYADTPIDKKKIEKTLEIAAKTPSICNRQSSRATVIYDRKTIEATLRLQNGITGYELPPAVIMITTDTSAFVGVNERNQVWIDGGLYAMSVLLGLEYQSIAACPLNAMMTVRRDRKMRKLLNVPDSENIIMFISVGNFLKESRVPKSFRYKFEETTREA